MYRKIVPRQPVAHRSRMLPTLKSVTTIRIWVNVGSRDELPGEEGLSHFSSTCFSRDAKSNRDAISREIDALGGEIDAFHHPGDDDLLRQSAGSAIGG